MIILDATTTSLQALLAGSITTNQLDIVSAYVELNTAGTSFASASNQTATNNTTAVSVVAAPASGFQRQIKYISVYNRDTAAATVTVRSNYNGTLRPHVVITLAVGSTLVYTDGEGWRVITANGDMLSAPSTTGATLYRASVTLTNAQILALPTTAVTVVPAPASGYEILLVKGLWRSAFTAGAYTNVDADSFAFYQWSDGNLMSQYLANDATDSITGMDDFFGTAVDLVAQFAPWEHSTTPADGWGTLPQIEIWEAGFGVQIKADNNGAGNFTGGNAANTLRVVTWYLLEPIP